MYFKKASILILFLGAFTAAAQNGYKLGQTTENIAAKKILNFISPSSSLKNLQSNITIIDFFGTWCAPCIRALPELSNYKTKFGNELSVILVSIEEESKLSKFINARQPFAFPIVVDEEKLFTSAFQPSSYPYTIVLDKNLKIIAITNAADLTEAKLKKFIDDSKVLAAVKNDTAATIAQPVKIQTMPAYTSSNNMLVKLSQNFMYAAKTGEDDAAFITQLKNLNYNQLLTQLKTDDDKKAFWINLYNAYTNSSLHKNPEQYKSRSQFFKNKNIIVAGKTFSLDKIEHGILRRSKIKWSLGYLNKLFPSKTEKQLRVHTLDYRIHFALNCGAKSCPPIAFYNPEMLNNQLDLATTAYLSGEVNYNKDKNVVVMPALLNWFRRDFGGKKKMIDLLKAKQLLAAELDPKIKFKKYDWTLYLDNFKK
jgi:thiol-disulfide isomerase/thioredoxin